MRVVRHESAEAFLADAGAWLARTEVEHNVMLGIAARLAQQPRAAGAPAYLASLHGAGGVAACALRTPPHGLLVTRGEREAFRALLEDLGEEAASLPSVGGPEPASAAFAALWAECWGGGVRLLMRQRLYALSEVTPLAARAPGRLRPATDGDFARIVDWTAGFLREAATLDPTPPEALARERLQAGSVFVWEHGRPVSMAAWTGKTASGVRVNLVYTPPEERRRGYASACVAALTRRLLEAGNRYCCLYADLANPVSNAIYQRIGYRAVCDWAVHGLAA